MEGFAERLREHGFTATVLGVPACFEAVFAPGPITDYRGTLRGDASLSRRLNDLLLERGIIKGETKYYLSIAHTDEDVRQTFDAWSDAPHRAGLGTARGVSHVHGGAACTGGHRDRARVPTITLVGTRRLRQPRETSHEHYRLQHA